MSNDKNTLLDEHVDVEQLAINAPNFFNYCNEHGNKILELIESINKNDECSFNETFNIYKEDALALIRLRDNPDISIEERKFLIHRISEIENDVNDMHFRQADIRNQRLEMGLKYLSILITPLMGIVASKLLNKKIEPKMINDSTKNINHS